MTVLSTDSRRDRIHFVLTIRYLKPTRIGVVSPFESEVTELTERRTHGIGRLIQDGVVTVEAVGEFVNMDRTKINALHRGDSGS